MRWRSPPVRNQRSDRLVTLTAEIDKIEALTAALSRTSAAARLPLADFDKS
jgi:hypothetical protein